MSSEIVTVVVDGEQVGREVISHLQNTQRAERPVLVREFAADITAGDGRTVDVRIIPFGEQIVHNDGLGGVPLGVEYREEWLPGVFDHQLKAADKIVGNYEHMKGPAGLVARGRELRHMPDGYHATFRMLDGSDADKTLELIREGVLDGISIEAQPVKNIKSAKGVIQRAKANLFAVAFTRFAAFAGAKVLAVREEAEYTFDKEILPVAPDPEDIARCRRLGIRLPQRYQAHPDPETDTPPDGGTSEDGTRHSVETLGTGEWSGANTSLEDAQ